MCRAGSTPARPNCRWVVVESGENAEGAMATMTTMAKEGGQRRPEGSFVADQIRKYKCDKNKLKLVL